MLESLRFTPFPDAATSLGALRASGIRAAVVSNWDCSLGGVLAGLGLGGLLDAVVTSAEVGVPKPDPLIFESALAAVQCPPAHAILVGDSLEIDVAGGRAAGIRSVLLDRGALGLRSRRRRADLHARQPARADRRLPYRLTGRGPDRGPTRPARRRSPGGRSFPVGARTGFLGLLVAALGTVVAMVLITIGFAAAGAEDLSNNHAFVLVATLAQDAMFVIAAYALTAEAGPVSASTFGLRPFGRSAIGTMAVAFGAYWALSLVYSALVAPPCDKLPDDLGIHESAVLATLAGIFVIVDRSARRRVLLPRLSVPGASPKLGRLARGSCQRPDLRRAPLRSGQAGAAGNSRHGARVRIPPDGFALALRAATRDEQHLRVRDAAERLELLAHSR